MLSVGGMNAGMMNMNRNDARVFTRNDAAPKESLPLASDYFTKTRLSAHSAHEYELIALALMENALERSRKERIYGGADESWRDIGAMHGFKRFTKMEGKAQHYRVQGVVRAPLSNVMDMLYAERNASIPLRRNAFYGNGMDGQTLHVLRPRTDNDRHQHLTLRWEAFNIQTATDNFKFDSSHIEYTGVSLDQDRQPVGFKITHSVELPQVKSLLKSHGLHRLEGTEIITLRGTSNNAYTDLTLEGSIEVDDRLPTSALSAYLTQISQQLSRLPMEIQSRRLGAMKIMDKSMWVPANERKNCSVCLSRFGVLGKKHHCRTCGEVICKPCIVTRPNNEEMKFCKKCVVVACADQELVIPDRNPISTPSSHSSSSSRHREARDSYASSLSRQSDERLSASVFMPQQQMKQPTKTVSQSNSRGYDYRYADDLKHHREDNHSINSMTASETSFGSSTFSSTGFGESTTPQFDSGYYERPEGSMIYLDTRQMKRGTPEDYTPVPTYNSGRGYTVRQPAPVSEEFSPYSSGIGFSGRQPASMQDVESSLAQQRHILQEMMHQANRSYRSNAPVKVKY